MEYFIITFAFFAIAVTLMAIGVIVSNRRIKGSCGGIGAAMGEDCSMCDCGRKLES